MADFQPFNPLPQHGVPRPGAPRHNVIFNRFFFRNFQADILALQE